MPARLLPFPSVALFCLAILTLLPIWESASGAAQSQESSGTGKPSAFEVFTIRPHDPRNPQTGWDYTPDGFRGTTTFDYLIT